MKGNGVNPERRKARKKREDPEGRSSNEIQKGRLYGPRQKETSKKGKSRKEPENRKRQIPANEKRTADIFRDFAIREVKDRGGGGRKKKKKGPEKAMKGHLPSGGGILGLQEKKEDPTRAPQQGETLKSLSKGEIRKVPTANQNSVALASKDDGCKREEVVEKDVRKGKEARNRWGESVDETFS